MPNARRHFHAIGDGGQLRHPNAGDDARGADRTRADADLDGVRTGLDQRPGRLARRHVPAMTGRSGWLRLIRRTCSITLRE